MKSYSYILIENFNQTIHAWAKALAQYSFVQLSTKPSLHSWSLGQLYTHLIEDTNYYILQIKICVTVNDHRGEEASAAAKTMFRNNAFPDEAMAGDPSNAYIPQPDSKEQLLNDLMTLKDDMTSVGILIANTSFEGKTKHPGLGYFNAAEWLQFADMHFRHHLRQKKRIDIFLQSTNTG